MRLVLDSLLILLKIAIALMLADFLKDAIKFAALALYARVSTEIEYWWHWKREKVRFFRHGGQ